MYESTVNQEITRLLSKAILSDEIKAGEQLESSRDLAKKYKVNVNIVNQVIQQMVAKGILRRDEESKVFVTEDATVIEGLRETLQEMLIQDYLRASAAIGVDTNQAIKRLVNKGDVRYVEVKG